MSKSKGNFIPLRDLVKKYGADLTRINIVASNENMDDADWREESIPTYDSRIKYLFELVSQLKKIKEASSSAELKAIDMYMQSRLQEIIQTATDAYEHMKFRTATQHALFGLLNEIKWYIERVGDIKECNKDVLTEAVETAVKLIAPLVPHVAEELWSKLGNKPFVSVQLWPAADKTKIDRNVIEMENEYKKTLEDIKQVKKLAESKTTGTIKHLCLYFATAKELNYFQDSIKHLKKLGFEKVSLFKADDKNAYDPQGKASRAKYGKPGIYLE